MTNRKLDGVVFDLDGVLVTTDTFHYQAWKMLADELGLGFNEEVNHQLRGVSRAESLKLIYRHNGRSIPSQQEFDAQMKKKNDRYVELIGRMTPDDVLPGVVTLCKELHARGIKCAIASASKNTPLVLRQTKLDAFMDAVADGNVAKKSKPDPEVFLIAAGMLGVEPGNCIGVEDAEAGVVAIKAAGMVSLGIGPSAAAADKVVDAVSDVSIDDLRALFARRTGE